MTASWLVSDSPFDALLSATAVAVCLAGSVWIAIRRPGLGLISFFFLFAFAWRLVSVLYIDLSGPLISQQLGLEIGPGTSVLPIAISQGLVVIALLFSFRRQRMQSLTCASGPGLAMSIGRFSLPDLAFCAAALFVVALWAEFLARGQIPLLAGIERFDYTRLYGGFLHRRLMEWGPMLAFQLGIFFAAPLVHDKPLDWRFGALLGALILYLFLAGHRFSSFYVYASFFVMPIGAILIGRLARSSSDGNAISKRLLAYFAVGGVALAILVVTAVVYSYVVVRGEGAELLAKLSQRILVQQGEMWWMTYKRVFLEGNWNGSFAAYKLFVEPFDPSRNSTMQFLMESALPLIRAHRILGDGSAYSGGWPEVLFELGGPIGGFVLVALSAIVFSEFMFLMTRCIVQERYATCFFLTPLLYAVSVNLVSGMVNSFIQMTFLIKVVAALVVYLAEDRWRSLLLSRQSASSEKEV
ncbi:DUF6418 domain-containing protein [Bradyrhizobium sp. AZCC 1693]|uniref:DUF6418 domain-containing protein n=1 Tax=Bradyrhizobium sp. AZCC 1693 TaxID=3117029 RepID=UPI002FF33309